MAPPPPSVPGHGLSIAGMVLGIVGLVLAFIPCCLNYVGLLLGFIGLALSIVGLIKSPAGKKGAAIAGTICSVMAIVIGLVWMIAFLSPVWAVNREMNRHSSGDFDDAVRLIELLDDLD